MSQLINTIGSGFTALVDFFGGMFDAVVDFLSFLWGLIDGIGYGFNTIVTKVYELFNKVTFYDYFTQNDFVMLGLDKMLGSPALQVIIIFLSLTIILIILRFVFSLIPFFNKKR